MLFAVCFLLQTGLLVGLLRWLLNAHAAREYLLLEQVRQLRTRLDDCMTKLAYHQEQHRQMLMALQQPQVLPAAGCDEEPTEGTLAERFRDHPAPPGTGPLPL